MIIDSHIHLQFDQYQDQLDELIKEARNAGVRGFICIGAGSSPTQAVKLAEKYDFVYSTRHA